MTLFLNPKLHSNLFPFINQHPTLVNIVSGYKETEAKEPTFQMDGVSVTGEREVRRVFAEILSKGADRALFSQFMRESQQRIAALERTVEQLLARGAGATETITNTRVIPPPCIPYAREEAVVVDES